MMQHTRSCNAMLVLISHMFCCLSCENCFECCDASAPLHSTVSLRALFHAAHSYIVMSTQSKKSSAHCMPCNATPVPLDMQASASSGSLSSAGGQSASGGTDYLKSALDASAAQKDTFFARKMEVSTGALQPRDPA